MLSPAASFPEKDTARAEDTDLRGKTKSAVNCFAQFTAYCFYPIARIMSSHMKTAAQQELATPKRLTPTHAVTIPTTSASSPETGL